MNAIRTHHHCRRFSLALIMVMVVSLLPMGLVGAWGQGQRKSVIVFPVTVTATGAPDSTGDRAIGLLSFALGQIPGYGVMQFSPNAPLVRRAVAEGRIRQVDAEDADLSLAAQLTVAYALKMNYVVVASVQSYTVKENPLSIEVILSGQMYDVNANIDPTSGLPIDKPTVMRAFGVSGASVPRVGYQGSQTPLLQEALRSAAEKAADALSGRPQAAAATAPSKPHVKSNYKWVILALLIGGLALAANRSGGGGVVTPGTGATPPTNVTVEPQNGQVRLTWQAPTNTTLTLLRYQVDRAVDGGAFSRADTGNLGPTTTSFTDFNTLQGQHVYQYRIRAIYTSGVASVYVPSGAIVVTK